MVSSVWFARTIFPLALFFACVSASAQAVSANSIFGITIGEPLSVAPCSTSDKDTVCFVEGALGPMKTTWGSMLYSINIPSGLSLPWGVRDRRFSLETYNDEVVTIGIVTYGEQSQAFVFKELKAKFGKPSSTKYESLQNAYGAQFKGIVASWRTSALKVVFKGIDGELGYGSISITGQSANARESEGARIAFRNKKGKSLEF